MISYEPFWTTLKNSRENTYTLIQNHNISSSTIDKLRKNKPTNIGTLDKLCDIFNCELQDIVIHVRGTEETKN
jgi:DNA-binding Xre family transcriptional regulator